MSGTGNFKMIYSAVAVVACAVAGYGCAGDVDSGVVDARPVDAGSGPDVAGPDTVAPDSAPAHWGYEGAEGPAHWGEEPGYELCGTGTAQSPVNIQEWMQFAPLAGLTYAYAAAPATIKDNGHTVQVDFTAGTNKVTLGGKDFDLAQFHFHAHSEHTVAGASFPLEMHLVHRAADGELAVLGILFKVGAENTALVGVFNQMAAAATTPAALAANLDPATLLPGDRNGWAYAGSLTTPPCSEGVRWHLYSSVLEVSAAQLAAFTGRHPTSYRPPQSLNARTITGGNGSFAAAHWEYEVTATDGPAHWGDLGIGEYSRCKTGVEQSPLDIPSATATAAPLAGVVTSYAPAPATIVDNGHTVQVAFTGGTNKITLGAKDFNLLQFHFHAGSEHTVGGARYPLEMHLVHRAADGELAVLGVMFATGADSVALGPVFDRMATATATPIALSATVDPSVLLPSDRNGWAYSGSLTTPPCTEGVRWHVYATPLPVSEVQLDLFHHDQSYRPVQLLGGRTVAGGN